MTPVSMGADLVRRYLAGHGRRRVFRPEDDLDVFHKWLRTTDLAGEWRGCRALAGQTSDSGLLDAIEHEHPNLVHHTHAQRQDSGGRETVKVKIHLARSTPSSSDETPVVWPATWPPPSRGDTVVLADGALLKVLAVTWCPQSEDGPFVHVVAVGIEER